MDAQVYISPSGSQVASNYKTVGPFGSQRLVPWLPAVVENRITESVLLLAEAAAKARLQILLLHNWCFFCQPTVSSAGGFLESTWDSGFDIPWC